MVLENDTRGWIMAATSGIACTFGAAIICVDLLVQQLPGRRRFKIQDSNPFLSAGLSLSFGVMICSSLYSMLPSARSYLQKGGLAPRPAGFVMVACFLAGAVGIAVLSRIIHRFIPHSVVDCSHDHGDEEENMKQADDEENIETTTSPTSENHRTLDRNCSERLDSHSALRNYGTIHAEQNMSGLLRRPSIPSRVSKLVTGHKEFCDEQGQCHGYSDPCGQECFKIVQQTRSGARHPGAVSKSATRPAGLRTVTAPQERHHLLEDVDEYEPLEPVRSNPIAMETTSEIPDVLNGSTDSLGLKLPRSSSGETQETVESHHSHAHHAHHPPQTSISHSTHHHHVPTNVFLSIGLQTSIAIALHKLPEGFITYATNHANPRLGVTVFLALFIHNITEGFAMALPLYLAINSRWKAMFWSALLGGFTQPMGAGLAALWFRVAGKDQDGWRPGERVYGVMFAVTAGIMAMVALQLFGESLDLTHSRKLCFGFAFAGMGILGMSSALTA